MRQAIGGALITAGQLLFVAGFFAGSWMLIAGGITGLLTLMGAY